MNTQIFLTVVRASSLIIKGFCVAESGVRIYQICHKPGPWTKEERHEVIYEVIRAIFQTADLTVSGCRMSSKLNTDYTKAVNLLTSFGVGSVDVYRAYTVMPKPNEAKWMNVTAVLLFRLGDLASVGASQPLYCAELHKTCEITSACSELAGAGLFLISRKESFMAAGAVIGKWVKRNFNRRKGHSQTAVETNEVASQAGLGKGKTKTDNLRVVDSQPESNDDDFSDDDDNTVSVLPVPISIHNPEEAKAYFENIYDKVINWDKEDSIPDHIAHDPILKQFKCAITNKCIRHIVRPKAENGIYYEKATISQFLDNALKDLPPKWPKTLPFKEDNIKVAKSLQILINHRLEQIAQEFKEIRKTQQS